MFGFNVWWNHIVTITTSFDRKAKFCLFEGVARSDERGRGVGLLQPCLQPEGQIVAQAIMEREAWKVWNEEYYILISNIHLSEKMDDFKEGARWRNCIQEPNMTLNANGCDKFFLCKYLFGYTDIVTCLSKYSAIPWQARTRSYFVKVWCWHF